MFRRLLIILRSGLEIFQRLRFSVLILMLRAWDLSKTKILSVSSDACPDDKIEAVSLLRFNCFSEHVIQDVFFVFLMKTWLSRLRNHAVHTADNLKTDKITMHLQSLDFQGLNELDCEIFQYQEHSVHKAFSPKFDLHGFRDLKAQCGHTYSFQCQLRVQ